MFSFKYLLGGEFSIVSFLFIGGNHRFEKPYVSACDDARVVVALPDGSVHAAISDGISSCENSRYASARIVQTLASAWFNYVHFTGWQDEDIQLLYRVSYVMGTYSHRKGFRKPDDPDAPWLHNSLSANGLMLRVDNEKLSVVRVSDLSVFLGDQSGGSCELKLLKDDVESRFVTPIGFHQKSVYSRTLGFPECGLQALVTTDGFTRYLKEGRLYGSVEGARNDRYKRVAFQLPEAARQGREAEWLELFRSTVAAISHDLYLSTTKDDITGVYVAPRNLQSVWGHQKEHPLGLAQRADLTYEELENSWANFRSGNPPLANLRQGSIYRAVEGFEAQIASYRTGVGHIRMAKLSREGALGSDGLPIQWLDSRVLEDGTAVMALATADPSYKDGAFAAGFVVHSLLLEVMARENLRLAGMTDFHPQGSVFGGLSAEDLEEIILFVLARLKETRPKWQSDSAEVSSVSLAILDYNGMILAHAGGAIDVGVFDRAGKFCALDLRPQEHLTADGDVSVALHQAKGFPRDLLFAPLGTVAQLEGFVNPLNQEERGLAGIRSLMWQVPVNVAADALVQQLDPLVPEGQVPPSFLVIQMGLFTQPWVSALDGNADSGPVLLPKVGSSTSVAQPTAVTTAVGDDGLDWKNMPEPKVDRGLMVTMSKSERKEYLKSVRLIRKKWASYR